MLVTTPESLFILLTSESGRRALRDVRTVIVDEIHAVAADKRGAHLALSLERLRRWWRPAALQRVGLSATVRPLDVAARLLVGDRPPPEIVDVGQRRDLDLAIEVPEDELGAVCTNEQWARALRSRRRAGARAPVDAGVRQHAPAGRARGAAPGRAARRRGRSPPTTAACRASAGTGAERRLKAGELRVVVATASLELGIDVGAVDLTCLIGSPRSIATVLQRIGRSGHALRRHAQGAAVPAHARPAGRVRGAGARGATRRDRRGPRCATRRSTSWRSRSWRRLRVRGVGRGRAVRAVGGRRPTPSSTRADFDAVVDMLSEGIATSRGRAGALLHRDAVNRRLRGAARRAAGGAHLGRRDPRQRQLRRRAGARGHASIGTSTRTSRSNRWRATSSCSATASWRIRRVETGPGARRGRGGRAADDPVLARRGAGAHPRAVGRGRGAARGDRGRRRARRGRGAGADDRRARSTGAAPSCCATTSPPARPALGACPRRRASSPSASSTRRAACSSSSTRRSAAASTAPGAWRCASASAARSTSSCRPRPPTTASCSRWGRSTASRSRRCSRCCAPDDVEELLIQAALQAPMFETRWRWNATRSLALLRMPGRQAGAAAAPAHARGGSARGGVSRRRPPARTTTAAAPIEVPDHPLVRETMRDCLVEAMDVAGLRAVLDGARTTGASRRVGARAPRAVGVRARDPERQPVRVPRRRAARGAPHARGQRSAAGCPPTVVERIGGLDPAGDRRGGRRGAARSARRRRAARSAARPGRAARGDRAGARLGRICSTTLVADRRAARLRRASRVHWVAAERRSAGGRGLARAPVRPRRGRAARRGGPRLRRRRRRAGRARARHARRCWARRRPSAIAARARRRARPTSTPRWPRLEMEGARAARALPAPTRRRRQRRSGATGGCSPASTGARSTACAARSSRCSAADCLRFLFGWQHVRPGHASCTAARAGARDRAAAGLRGRGRARGSARILPARVAGYDPALARRALPLGRRRLGTARRRGPPAARPSRAAPIALVRRADLPWLLAPRRRACPRTTRAVGPPARDVLAFLARAGASFLDEIIAGTRRLRAEVEDALGELVSAGRVTGDGFAGLRALISADADARRRARTLARALAPAHGRRAVGAGRWSLLRSADAPPPLPDRQPPNGAWPTRPATRRWRASTSNATASCSAICWRARRRRRRGAISCASTGAWRCAASCAAAASSAASWASSSRRPRPSRRCAPCAASRTRGEIVRLSACDPLNLVGIITPGARVPAALANTVIYDDGVPQTAVAARGDRRRPPFLGRRRARRLTSRSDTTCR